MTKPITKKEFDEFKKSNDANIMAILDAVKGLQNNPPPSVGQSMAPEPRRVYSVTGTAENPPMSASREMESASAASSNYTLNPAYQAIFDEYFDPADGFEGRLEYPYFSIIVPSKFSNADPAWRKYYKTDTRLKFLKHDNIEGGMRDWCKLVASNLKYNKHVKTK